jgi:hypothetical protein
MDPGQALSTAPQQATVTDSRPPEPGPERFNRVIGYGSLLVLAFALPFDADGRKLIWTINLTVTNLTVLILAVAVLALISVCILVAEAIHGSADARTYFSRRRVPVVLIVAFLLSAGVSTTLARSTTQGITWFLAIVSGALLWLAIPIWLAHDTRTRVQRVATAIVAGAALASILGLLEVRAGSAFERYLLLFKFGPDVMGPLVRLSATFSSANVAAMYFELALPLAVVGLLAARGRTGRRWLVFAAWAAAVDLLLLALALTFSRGAFLGLAAAGLAMGLLGWRAGYLRAASESRAHALAAAANLALVAGVIAFSTSTLQVARVSARSDRAWYEVSYASKLPASMSAGGARIIPVTVQNRGPLTWKASQPHAYGLSYHWLYPSWRVERFSNPITWLRADVLPGGSRLVGVRVQAPEAPGSYLLIWDTVWKGTTWFGPRTGEYQTLSVRVLEPRSPSGRPGTIRQNLPPDVMYLPTNAALGRSQLWTAAVSMIEGRPFFGVGPQGFRMNYTAYATPDPPAPPPAPPPHAHNLALEMLADWGVIGGGIFFALLAALLWPVIWRAWTRWTWSVWELAVIGSVAALLVHELVDFFLTKQSIFILFWILCGLAAVMTGDELSNRPTLEESRNPAD